VIAHLVLFTPKPDLDTTERQRVADAFTAAVTHIPSVRRATVGRRVTHGRPYEQLMRIDYTHVAIIEFDDLAGLQAYLNHPAHEVLATQFFAAFEHALMYDFDLEEGERGVRTLLEEERA
jgi:Stress responsive A/B Barrel Domain